VELRTKSVTIHEQSFNGYAGGGNRFMS